ncbi:hypothetical protein RRG08_053025 [Elysia crispata]|uniref:Secreted protein n=1 Tax=Elysia crispata TaxID=231223 RepID=A0AAE1CSM2_9GAST|nr:hypothetical protein RRG08_053025 [Elysia crispata]
MNSPDRYIIHSLLWVHSWLVATSARTYHREIARDRVRQGARRVFTWLTVGDTGPKQQHVRGRIRLLILPRFLTTARADSRPLTYFQENPLTGQRIKGKEKKKKKKLGQIDISRDEDRVVDLEQAGPCDQPIVTPGEGRTGGWSQLVTHPSGTRLRYTVTEEEDGLVDSSEELVKNSGDGKMTRERQTDR